MEEEIYDLLKKRSKERRASNTESSTKILTEKGVKFESKNNGAHLIVFKGKKPAFDFWPSTGKFINRNTSKGGRGVFSLLKKLEEKQ